MYDFTDSRDPRWRITDAPPGYVILRSGPFLLLCILAAIGALTLLLIVCGV